jgi:hypothetical protein
MALLLSLEAQNSHIPSVKGSFLRTLRPLYHRRPGADSPKQLAKLLCPSLLSVFGLIARQSLHATPSAIPAATKKPSSTSGRQPARLRVRSYHRSSPTTTLDLTPCSTLALLLMAVVLLFRAVCICTSHSARQRLEHTCGPRPCAVLALEGVEEVARVLERAGPTYNSNQDRNVYRLLLREF